MDTKPQAFETSLTENKGAVIAGKQCSAKSVKTTRTVILLKSNIIIGAIMAELMKSLSVNMEQN